jgi:hypothetical protein
MPMANAFYAAKFPTNFQRWPNQARIELFPSSMPGRTAERCSIATPDPDPPPYPAEKARGGEIILRKPWQRALFIDGLVGMVVLILILRLE